MAGCRNRPSGSEEAARVLQLSTRSVRRLLVRYRAGDYFTIDIDTTGALVAGYSDTRQGGAVSLPAFLRQTGGTSFVKRPPIGKGK